MNVQKLGLVLGVNMVAACLMMQGCAAPGSAKAGRRGVPPSQALAQSQSNGDRITVISMPPPGEGPQVAQTTSSTSVTTTPEPAATPAQPAKSPTVTQVKPLPPQGAKPTKTKVAAAPAATPAVGDKYVVKPGDTLFLISKRTNYRQSAILAANPGLSPDRIRVGQKINLPGTMPASAVAKVDTPKANPAEAKGTAKDAKVMPAAAPAPAAANTKAPVKTKGGFAPYEGPTKEYVVKAGDSLGKIAMEYGISIRALKALNGLQKDNLRLSQKLKVPTEKQTTAKATVAAKPVAAKTAAAKPAEAAKDAAPKKADTVKEPTATAPVASEAAKPADAVVEKSADTAKPAEAAKPEEPVAPVAEVTAPAAEPAAPVPTYTVKEGDDLVSIAIAYGISPSALMDINDLKPTDEIKPGQVLKLPANAKVSIQ